MAPPLQLLQCRSKHTSQWVRRYVRCSIKGLDRLDKTWNPSHHRGRYLNTIQSQPPLPCTHRHRHVRDPYVRAAKKDDLRSRAAFKLKEMQAKAPIIRPGDW